jgi:ubiquinone/menaquinone biosynthesis C-methylase UbiE
MIRRRALLAAACALPLAARARAEKDPNEKFRRPDLDVEAWRKRFETRGREIYDRRDAIVAATGVKSGDGVADIGAGTGLFSMLFARRVAPGKVYAVDIAPRFLAAIDRRARGEGLKNVVTVRGSDRSIEVPAGAVDLVFVCDTYHHFEHPADVLASIRRALRPGGALVVVDFKREPGKTPQWIVEHVRAGQEAVTREIVAAGFAPPEELPILKESYFLRFRVPR